MVSTATGTPWKDYCPSCGTQLDEQVIDGRERRYCPDCEDPVYHNPVPTASVAIFDGQAVLVGRRTSKPGEGQWTVPGGFIEIDETPVAGAIRELREETGASVPETACTVVGVRRVEYVDGRPTVAIGFRADREDLSASPSAKAEFTDVGFRDAEAVLAADAGVRPHARTFIEAGRDLSSHGASE